MTCTTRAPEEGGMPWLYTVTKWPSTNSAKTPQSLCDSTIKALVHVYMCHLTRLKKMHYICWIQISSNMG